MLTKKRGNVAQVFKQNKFVDEPIEDVLNHLIDTSQDEITAMRKANFTKVPYIKSRYLNTLQMKIKENEPETIEMLKEELRNTMYNNKDLVVATFKQMLSNLSDVIDE
jgi:hypothetical protein